jgi:hypothetical protein
LNSYEIAILRILVKKNLQPIAIHNLIEGFPDGSEDKVNDAISNLENSELIRILSGFPVEEKYVIYNQDKKQDILKIIDPLYGKIKENNYNTYDNIVKYKEKKNKNDKLRLSQSAKPINITISAIFVIVIAFVLTSIPQTTEIEQIYNLSHINSKLQKGDSQAYGDKEIQNWNIKPMDRYFKNYFVKYQFDFADESSSESTSFYCKNT